MRVEWLAFLLASRALAQVDLSVEAPCADASALRAEVEGLLERPIDARDPALQVRVSISSADRWHASIDLDRDGAPSHREVAGDSCERMVSAAALMIALALERPEVQQPAAPEPEPEDDDAIEVGSIAIDVPHPSGPRLLLDAAFGVEVGALAAPQLALRAGGGLEIAPIRMEIEAAFVTQSRSIASEPGASVEAWLAFATLRAGPALRPFGDAFAIVIAADLEIGAVRGTADGIRVAQASSAWVPWCALRATAIAEVPLAGPIALRAVAGIGTPLASSSFVIEPIGAVYRPSPVLFSAYAAIAAGWS